jgi:hypothetical protein
MQSIPHRHSKYISFLLLNFDDFWLHMKIWRCYRYAYTKIIAIPWQGCIVEHWKAYHRKTRHNEDLGDFDNLALLYVVPPRENKINMYLESPGNTQICNVNRLSSNDEYNKNNETLEVFQMPTKCFKRRHTFLKYVINATMRMVKEVPHETDFRDLSITPEHDLQERQALVQAYVWSFESHNPPYEMLKVVEDFNIGYTVVV